MQDVIARLERLIEEGQSFTYENFSEIYDEGYPMALTPKWFSWIGRTRMLAEATFGMESPVGEMLTMGLNIAVIGDRKDAFNNSKSHIIGALTTALDSIQEGFPTRRPMGHSEIAAAANGRVFIVHGHDNELKTDLEVFLKNVGLDPIVLHREADQGATLLEKFERHSDVGYAFILLTPDEVAYTANQRSLADSERAVEERARPNVIFEFGFFVGRLGRSRVCCLYKGNVTLPSDLNGLVYKKITNSVEEQGFSLIKELRAAGYAINV